MLTPTLGWGGPWTTMVFDDCAGEDERGERMRM